MHLFTLDIWYCPSLPTFTQKSHKRRRSLQILLLFHSSTRFVTTVVSYHILTYYVVARDFRTPTCANKLLPLLKSAPSDWSHTLNIQTPDGLGTATDKRYAIHNISSSQKKGMKKNSQLELQSIPVSRS